MDCLRLPQLTNINNFINTVYGSDFKVNTLTINDPDAGHVKYSSDNSFSCTYSQIPYTQTLQQTSPVAVLFVPPGLINEVAEQMETLRRVRLGCSQLIDTYNSYLTNMASLDIQDNLQQSVQYISGMIEYYTLSTYNGPPNIGLKPGNLSHLLGPCTLWQQSNNMPSLLLSYRLCMTSAAADVRKNVKDETINNDYKHQFDNAKLAIDTQARVVGRALLALDSTEIASLQGPVVQQNYQNGTWVQKGTVVLTTGP